MYLNKKLTYRFLSKFMSSFPINFLYQLNPASLSISFLSNFYVVFSLEKATSLACVTQLVLLYFAPFLSFSTPFFPALHCCQMLDPTSAGSVWRSATAPLSARGQLWTGPEAAPCPWLYGKVSFPIPCHLLLVPSSSPWATHHL